MNELINQDGLLASLDKISFTLERGYLDHLESILSYETYCKKSGTVSYPSNIRAIRVHRWVYDKSEQIVDRFKNLLSVYAGSTDVALALLIRRTPMGAEMYFVTKNTGEGRNEDSTNEIKLLAEALCGNFPGSTVEMISASETESLMEQVLDFDANKSIACLSNIPSDKSENDVFQGIEKLLNGIVPKTNDESYVIVMLAQALDSSKVHEILTGYEELATALTPYSGHQFQKGKNESESLSEMEALSHTDAISTAITHTHSVNCSVNTGGGSVGYSFSRSKTKSVTSSDTQTKGVTKSVSVGTSENTTYTYKSYTVNNLLMRLEKNLERIQKGQANGLWFSASYVLAQHAKTSENVACFLRSLSQGDDSFPEPAFIQRWSQQGEQGITIYHEAQKYIKHFSHPVFTFDGGRISVTPTSCISTPELSRLFAFPEHSVQGLPVIGCARFGREPHFERAAPTSSVDIGCAYHMRTIEKNNRICLDLSDLTAHAFITGSTGSGKSNTVYTLIDQLHSLHNIPFLVIEPAKGEYKHVFGGCPDVNVYGTNPQITPLLRLDPFSFPEEIHVLEHIDRLVEIFNACWPMYAAMPAVLKASIETAYTDCGWDLKMSEYVGKQRSFPTFRDVMKALPKVVDTKGFSNDTRGDYKGALLTRLESLTNGINGQIFCSLDGTLSDEALFDQSVIVDLSRVGSMETKSLLMGILMIKLQEYRMAKSCKSNCDLRHITVLEEAHNLLRRTASEQSQESSNLQGKSVEMLSNAIAEMRTYGEGFIIADQAPGLLDMAVIRNTNTKIILRLPDESDRVLSGKAAGLDDDQIVELSRLDTGVAAVYQNNWLEPVLCKVTEFKREQQRPFVYKPTDADTIQNGTPYMNVFFDRIVNAAPTVGELNAEDVDRLKNWIENLPVGRNTKLQLLDVLHPEGKLDVFNKGEVLYRLANGNDVLKYVGSKADREAACGVIDQQIMQRLGISREVAEQVRREIFLYAASQIDRERFAVQYAELQRYAELSQRGIR